jgi:magnesium-transporting ATPase (P-type)
MSDVLSSSDFELTIDNECRRYLYDTSRWGKFLAITGLILSVVIFIFMAYLAFEGPQNRDFFISEQKRAALRAAYMVMAVICSALYIIPSLMLLRYSSKLKNALTSNNQEELAVALRAQKNLYIYMGILTIIILAFTVLGALANAGTKN